MTTQGSTSTSSGSMRTTTYGFSDMRAASDHLQRPAGSYLPAVHRRRHLRREAIDRYTWEAWCTANRTDAAAGDRRHEHRGVGDYGDDPAAGRAGSEPD